MVVVVGGGGGNPPIWPIRGRTAGLGMVFGLSNDLKGYIIFMIFCPKQG